MTLGAFGLTRFAVDPFFSKSQVDDFYTTWATNLFSGLADAVFIAEIEGRPAGFVSTKLSANDQGRIPLVATASEFQRRGIARGLVAAALAWFADAGCSVARVKTQAANYPAVALYERAGFTVTQSELTFTTTIFN
jgi:ribosomal protein S18 acetylase RimI-like enzyme